MLQGLMKRICGAELGQARMLLYRAFPYTALQFE